MTLRTSPQIQRSGAEKRACRPSIPSLAQSLCSLGLVAALSLMLTDSAFGRTPDGSQVSSSQSDTGFIWIAQGGPAAYWRIAASSGARQQVTPPRPPKSLRSKGWKSYDLAPSEDGSSWAGCCHVATPSVPGHPQRVQKFIYQSVAYETTAKRWHEGTLCSLNRRRPRARQWCPLGGVTFSDDGRYEVGQVFSDSWRTENELDNLVLDPQTYGLNSPYLGIFDTFSGKLVHRLRLACKPAASGDYSAGASGASASFSPDGKSVGYACVGGPDVGIYLVSTSTWGTEKVPHSEALFDTEYDSTAAPLNWSPDSTSAIVDAAVCGNSARENLIGQLEADGLNDYGSRAALESHFQICPNEGISVAVDLTSGEAAPVTPVGPNALYKTPVYGASDNDLFSLAYPCSGGDCKGALARFTPTAPGSKVEGLTNPVFNTADESLVLFWAAQ